MYTEKTNMYYDMKKKNASCHYSFLSFLLTIHYHYPTLSYIFQKIHSSYPLCLSIVSHIMKQTVMRIIRL